MKKTKCMGAEAKMYTSEYNSSLHIMQKENPTANDMILSLAGGNMAVLDQIYDSYRDDFLRWASQRFQFKNRDDLLDAWHDSMIIFYEQVRDKKLTRLTCEMKTYLFIIAFRRLLKIFKKNEKLYLVDEFDFNMDKGESISVVERQEMNEELEAILKTTIQELPEKSRQILIMRFMEGMPVPDIMKTMGYASENVVSVTLSRGLKKLKELFGERMLAHK